MRLRRLSDTLLHAHTTRIRSIPLHWRADARSTLAGYSRAILSCREYLREAFQNHGDHIYDCWRKCNQRKRVDVLRAAEPGLPKLKGHMDEIECFRKGWAQQKAARASLTVKLAFVTLCYSTCSTSTLRPVNRLRVHG
ncbi:hypothetical protein M3J09_011066 [Ascochyta lentis]